MTAKKLIALALLGALLLTSWGTLLSCSKGGGGSASVTTAAGDAAETEPEEVDSLAARMKVSDGLENTDFEGKTFGILGDDACLDYYLMEEETGDVLDDSIYQRNMAVSERFNVELDAKVFPEAELTKNLKNSVMAGDNEYQLFAGHIIYAGMAVGDGIYYNWYDMPFIDFEKPWWSDSNVNDLTYKGKAFIAMGDFALTTIDSTYAMYFNKQLAADNNLGNLYQVTNEGKWTLDYLANVSKDVYRDLNGDGKAGTEDLYGFIMWARSSVNTFLYAFGEKLAKQQKDGSIVMDYYNEKVINIYEKFIPFLWESEGVYVDCAIPSGGNFSTMFLNDQALFYPTIFRFAGTSLREFETDYGIIPYPKWDEAQDEYYTMVDGGHEGLGIPLSVSETEFVGTIVEALNAESWKRVVPVYYDIVLKTKGSRDEESVEMLDRIFNNRIFDFGYVYGQWGAAFWVQYLVEAKSSDIASYYEKNHAKYDQTMKDVFEFFEEYSLEK